MIRAIEQRVRVRLIVADRWAVTSGTQTGGEYEVIRRYGRYACSCQARTDHCKHIAAVRYKRGELTIDDVDGDERYALELMIGVQ